MTSPRLPYVPSWRDRLAFRLTSMALRIATPTYRALLEGAWRLGLETAAMPYTPPTPPGVPPCDHDWTIRHADGMEWKSCFLCGAQTGWTDPE